jgi:hypothetical protein
MTVPESKEVVPSEAERITAAFAEPFDPAEIKWRAGVVSGNRALALAYIDARCVMERLDEVVGMVGWQDDYENLPDGSTICRLKIRVGDDWLRKTDVGGPSEQPDGGDRTKASFSDALKRAAVKWGIGRYLYRLPSQWVDWEPSKRQFVHTPKLPAFAMPASHQNKMPPAPAKNGATPQAAPLKTPPNIPANGTELLKRLTDYDAKLAAKKVIQQGELLTAVRKAGEKAGYPSDLATWPVPAIVLAVDTVKEFEALKEKAK